MFPGESADSTGAMLHLAMLLSFATIALGQASEQPAYVSIEINGRGDLSGTLTVAATPLPAGLPAAFARALACDVSGLANSPFESRIRVRCAGARPSALTFHAAVRLDKAKHVPILPSLCDCTKFIEDFLRVFGRLLRLGGIRLPARQE